MSDRFDYYFKQKVTEAELDEGFAALEAADRAQMTDMGLAGVTLGSVVQRGAGANISVDVGTHLAYDDAGQRLYIPSLINQAVAVDFVAASTDVAVAGRSKIVSVFLVFQRNLSDPRLDGNSISVFFSRAESYAIVVKQGAEALSPTPPPLEAGKVLLCDITRTFGQTQILNANISFARRQDMFRLAPSGSYALTGFTTKAIAQALQDALNAHVTGSVGAHAATAISYAGGPAWRDATTNPATTVEGQLDKILTDLGDSAVNGAARVSSLIVTGVNVALAAGSTRTQIVSLLAQLDTLWASVISVGAGVSGASFVGADAVGNLPVGTVRSQLNVLDVRSFQDRVSQARNWPERVSLTDGHASLNAVIPIAHDSSGAIGVLGGNRFVAIASKLSFTSEDGDTWTPSGASPIGASTTPKSVVVGIVGGSPAFLVGDAATTAMFKSLDGLSWSASGAVPANPTSSLLYVPAIIPWVVGSVSGNIATSTDGSTWTSRTVPAGYSGKEINALSSNGSIIVGITSSSYNKFITSPDGINWTERTVGATTTWNCIAYDATDGIFIAFGAAGGFKSSDGITWTAITQPNGGAASIASDGLGLWVATTSSGSFGGIAFSSDKGATWANISVGSQLTVTGWPRIIFAQRRFVMARSSATALEFALSARR